jgi:hypothetical protein
MVHVNAPGRHARDTQPLGESHQPTVSRPIVPPEGSLKLDPEPLAPERGHQTPPDRNRRRGVRCRGPATAAPKV